MTGKALVVAPENAVATLQQVILAIPDAPDSDDFDERSIARIMSADSLSDAMIPDTAQGMEELAGDELLIHAIAKRAGGANKKLGYYLLVDTENLSRGSRNVYSTGAVRIVAVLCRAFAEGELPLKCRVFVKESRDNPENKTHYLVTADHF